MKTLTTCLLAALLLCSCTKKDPGASQPETAQLINAKMAQFAAANGALLLDNVTTN
jgi:hypothetical protein